MRLLGLLLALYAAPFASRAAVCNTAAATMSNATEAQRIAAIACRENTLWYTPFIDADGRLASITVSEAESAPLSDGYSVAWKRVASYWRDSGLLGRMASFPGASECAYVSDDTSYAANACRAFLVDKPWSAAFVSYVMVQARLPGFQPGASHYSYVRDALTNAASAYRFVDPDAEAATIGDMLCFVRGNATALGFSGLRDFVSRGTGGALNMHCDIVVSADRDAGRIYMVGGNVLQGVTLRVLRIGRNGLLENLPRGAGRSTTCWPENEAGCNFNRQDWAALLKLRPPSELARLPPPVLPPVTTPSRASMPASSECCVNCLVGSGIPRCPVTPPPVR